MASLTTYLNCKTLYTIRKNNGELTFDFVEKQSNILDLFLMAERITVIQYNELMDLLKGVEETPPETPNDPTETDPQPETPTPTDPTETEMPTDPPSETETPPSID